MFVFNSGLGSIICDNCHGLLTNPIIVKGKKRELHYCKECLKQKNENNKKIKRSS